MELKGEVKGILDEADYEYSEYSGCFDIVARKHSTLFLKVLPNIDSLQFEQANNLKILSRQLDARTFVVGLGTRRENLENGVLYERFEITAVTPKTLENILLFNEMPLLCRFRGGMFAEIDSEKLRSARSRKGMTQRGLADRVGITKKSIYEHENKSMKAEYDIAKRLEKALGCGLRSPLTHAGVSATERNRPTTFERHVSQNLEKIGFKTELVHQAPFNIIAKERFAVFSDAAPERRRIERDAPYLKGFSGVVKKHVIAITREEANLNVPSIEERELRELRTARELERRIKKG